MDRVACEAATHRLITCAVANLKHIAGKLDNFLRLFASDKDGEVVSAARALSRTLKSGGADFHDLAGSGIIRSVTRQTVWKQPSPKQEKLALCHLH